MGCAAETLGMVSVRMHTSNAYLRNAYLHKKIFTCLDYRNLGIFCQISSHVLLVMCRYSQRQGFAALRPYFSKTDCAELRQVLRRMHAFRHNADLLYSMHKHIVRISNVLNTAKITCSNEKCGRMYFKYGDEYKQLCDCDSKALRSFKKSIVTKWRKCSACTLVYYCSRECQKYDWNESNHRAICKIFATRRQKPLRTTNDLNMMSEIEIA